MKNVPALAQQLIDRRGGKVIFLSHCLLNENVRYLGGAGRSGCVKEIVEQCLERGIGMVQMPCPEQHVWGGVLKRYLLRLYGLKRRSPLAYGLRKVLISAGMRYTRLIYRRLAVSVANQIEDYATSGFTVVGVVGIDGSPSCGVHRTMDPGAAEVIMAMSPDSVTVEWNNRLVRDHVMAGTGLFSEALKKELARRELVVPFLAHDLLEEMDGKPSSVTL